MRKKILSLLIAVLCLSSASYAQTLFTKPGPAAGEDVIVTTTHGCVPNGWGTAGEFANFDGLQNQISAWTIYAQGCANFETRTLIRFRDLDKICRNATILNATMTLYGVPNSGQAPQGNSHYPGSPYFAWGPNNNGVVERATGGWIENLVTWNTQPGSTPVNAVPIPNSTLQWNENYTFNVTALVQDIVNSGVNDGFKLSLVSETIYKNILWASSDDPNPNLWPELYVEYRCCDPNFTFCSNSQYPNTWTFTADDPTQPYTYKWDFGDATGATGPSVTHTYMAPGSYTVCLYLVDADGKVACEKCITICIKDIVEPPKDDPNGPKEASKMSNDDAAVASVTTGIMPTADGTVVITGINPNPAHSNLDVKLRLITGGNVDYKVYSLDGKTLMSGTKRMDKGAQSLSLSVERLPAGMYILELNDQYTKVNHKFSKE